MKPTPSGMTEAELLRRAEVLAAQQIVVQNFGMMNIPSDTEERIKFDARHMVEQDKLSILQKDYNAALRMYELDTYPRPFPSREQSTATP